MVTAPRNNSDLNVRKPRNFIALGTNFGIKVARAFQRKFPDNMASANEILALHIRLQREGIEIPKKKRRTRKKS